MQIADLRRSRNFKSIRSMSEFQFDHLRRYWRKVCNGNYRPIEIAKRVYYTPCDCFRQGEEILIKSFKEVIMVVMAYSPVPNEMNLLNQSND